MKHHTNHCRAGLESLQVMDSLDKALDEEIRRINPIEVAEKED